MLRDLKNNIKIQNSLTTAARTATANGTGVDTGKFESAVVLIVCGTVTDGTHTLKLQESDDDTTYSDVGSGNLQGSFTALDSTSDDTTQLIGYTGSKQYLRVVATVTGTPTTGGVYGAYILTGHPKVRPVS